MNFLIVVVKAYETDLGISELAEVQGSKLCLSNRKHLKAV